VVYETLWPINPNTTPTAITAVPYD
jgi:hypothetical protein